MRAADVINLAAEAPGVPMHMTVVAVLDGAPLCDPAGRFRLDAIRRTVSAGVGSVPRLRQVLHEPGPFAGRPLWVDAASFDVSKHVGRIVVPAPAGEDALLELAALVMVRPLDRRRPLWRMVFVTGLAEQRIGLIMRCGRWSRPPLGRVRRR
ncbi:hypothetical protein GCM10009539_05270 [Cryptosporangium japonicum]|uniref:O-acyltransferase WSD1-like N-terminal domain-containing protein n=1 Tax=Cryptosporangium japonicum TaxID=80872 RepID=A0ABN0TJ47_9ACTN